MPGALDGIRVLDLSWGIAGPLGVLLLAEHGADVIKVEPPGGDPFRVYDGARVWNRSRRSITVDLKHDDGREVMRKLLASADVIVESFRPGVMERLGFGYESVHAEFPRVIYLSVPAYPEGHRLAQRPGYDALVQASSGQMWEQPGWRMGPIFLHMPMPSMGAFFLVSMGITTALYAREKTGEGQHVETSLFQGALLYTTQIWQHLEKSNAATHELMGKTYPPGVHQPMIFECANDQWIHVSVMSGLPPIKPVDEILGLTDAPDPMTFLTMPPEQREQFTVARREKFKTWNRDELVAALLANNHAAEAIVPMEEAFAHPQVIANDMVATVVDPDLGPTTQMGVPIHMLGTPGAIQGPQPRAGEHTASILAELGYSASDVERLAAVNAR
jgi:crotonobetainyl-CoA:carnitine CoA-transferase CaiB-like acyl-CoA transferase